MMSESLITSLTSESSGFLTQADLFLDQDGLLARPLPLFISSRFCSQHFFPLEFACGFLQHPLSLFILSLQPPKAGYSNFYAVFAVIHKLGLSGNVLTLIGKEELEDDLTFHYKLSILKK